MDLKSYLTLMRDWLHHQNSKRVKMSPIGTAHVSQIASQTGSEPMLKSSIWMLDPHQIVLWFEDIFLKNMFMIFQGEI